MYTLKTINKKISEIIDRIDSAKSNNNDRRIIEAINDLEEAENVKKSIIIVQELNQK